MSDFLREPGGHVIFSGADRLEGILEWPSPPDRGGDEEPRAVGGVVVAHPHPLYGGTMLQPVVHRVAQACRERGFASLRFNFRGVGKSRGRYHGSEEYRDVEAAIAYLRGRLAEVPGDPLGEGRPPFVGLAGYSFGSVMAALAAGAGNVPIHALALVALVVRWEDWEPGTLDSLARFEGPVLAVCGEQDDVASPDSVDRVLRRLGLDYRLEVVHGTGHFFEHRQREVAEQVSGFFAEQSRQERSQVG